MLDLVRSLAAGDVAAGLDGLRAELIAGRDPSVLYHELGRLIRSLVQRSIDPSSATDYPAEHVERIGELASELGTGPLTRMIGLWVEQEPLLRGSANRELALEVACLRLARWPAVRELEALLAGGGGTVASPRSPTGGGSAGSGPARDEGPSHPPGSAGERLARALWDDHPRHAGGVEAADVRLDGDTLRLAFDAQQHNLASFLDGPDGRRVLEEVVARELPEVVHLVIEEDGEPMGAGAEPSPLEREARDDPQVALALSVLGGEITAVRSDQEPS